MSPPIIASGRGLGAALAGQRLVWGGTITNIKRVLICGKSVKIEKILV